MAERKFSHKQQAFINAYQGNATEAARKAGYKGGDNALGVQGHELLKNPKVAQAIKDRKSVTTHFMIAPRLERQAFWTSIMKDESLHIGYRLKASELLGKSEGDFLVKLEVTGKLTLEDLVAGSIVEVGPKGIKEAG